MPTLTLKKVPEHLYRKLKERASSHHRSMNGEAIALLEQALTAQPLDAEQVIAEAEALDRQVGKTLPDVVAEARREGRA